MAQDEGCFGRISTCRRAWAPPRVRPVAPRQVVREYSYVFAAVAPAQGRMTSLIMPRATTAMMNVFLAHVSAEYRESFVVMQVDGAAWHRSKELEVPENIRLIEQPAYSPEVNPVEHVWDELREKYFHNCVFDSLDEVDERLIAGLLALEADPQRLQSLTYFPHFRSCV
jgi:hypothetical protein